MTSDRAALGRAEAFRRLLLDGLDDAYGRASLLLGDRLEAEDAVHDAAERAWRRWPSLKDEARFEAWFGKILVNECRDRLRRRRFVSLIDPVAGDQLRVQADVLVEVAERDRVRRALATLKPDERIAVVLRYDADLTVPGIASLVGAPVGTIKSRLHTAHVKLRRALEGISDD